MGRIFSIGRRRAGRRPPRPGRVVRDSGGTNGTNAAKAITANFNRAGTYQFTVTITDSVSAAATSTVSVTVNQTLASIVVTPAGASVPAGGTLQYTASGYDQF